MRIMNRRATEASASAVRILVNGQAMSAVPGSSLSAALWNTGRRAFSAHPVTGRPQGPLCGMGVCQECLVWLIEVRKPTGLPDPAGVDETLPRGRMRLVRSCLEPVRAGLHVRFDPPAASGETSA